MWVSGFTSTLSPAGTTSVSGIGAVGRHLIVIGNIAQPFSLILNSNGFVPSEMGAILLESTVLWCMGIESASERSSLR
jgi:hypothetical protein